MMNGKASYGKSDLKNMVTLFGSLFEIKMKRTVGMNNTYGTEICGHPSFDHVFYIGQRTLVNVFAEVTTLFTLELDIDI